MQANLSHPLAQPALGILDLTTTLQATPSIPPNLTCTNIPPLSFLLLADRLAELYEMVLPDHPEWLSGEVVDWEDETAVAAAVERFLGRVNTLFPVHDDIWDVDLEVVEWRLYEIPVIPMGYDTWHDDWLDLKEPAPYLLHMRYSRRDEDSSYLRNEFVDLYSDHQVPRYLDPHRLVETLRQACAERSRSMVLPEPLDALPDLIEMLDHSTGNSFLDVGECALAEGGGYPQWNREEVEWLAEEWRKAQPVLDKVVNFLNWKNDSREAVAEKLTAVRDVLLEAYERRQRNEPADTTTPA